MALAPRSLVHRAPRVGGRSLRMPAIAVAFAIAGFGVVPAHVRAQTARDHAADEAAIRALVTRGAIASASDDAVFWSGAYARPMVGRAAAAHTQPTDSAEMNSRQNQRIDTHIVRLDVARAGDMAWEFSDFTLSFDRATAAANAGPTAGPSAGTGAHEQFTGSLLRVWEKRNGRWQIAAVFARPHDRPS